MNKTPFHMLAAAFPSLPATLAGLAMIVAAGCSRNDDVARPLTADEAAALPVEYALLTTAPSVPPPLGRRHAAHVIVDLEVHEVVKRLADGVDYPFWTFGGSVPGPFIRVRVGDLVEIRLHNPPSSKMAHNIDLHAVSGPGGGAASTLTAPGHTSVFSFTALYAGLFAYHCAAAPVPMHVGSGMYGLILVEPKNGLPHVDREYYVMQGEFYTAGRFGEAGLQSFDQQKADDERPTYVVFNGAVGSLVGDHALTANVGETVRIFFGNGGPNLTSAFHIIGTIFDNVYEDGGALVTQHDVQTTTVSPGCAVIVEFHARVPGNLTMVDHALSRSFDKGALGLITVTGPANKLIYSGKIADEPYSGTANEAVAAASVQPAKAADLPPPGGPVTREVQMERGKAVFLSACFACHQPDGKGLPGVFPPLAGSDFLKTDRERAIRIPINGLSGPITVNGRSYNNLMPPQPFTDEQIADALTYVMNSWGNDFGTVATDEVKRARQQTQQTALSTSSLP